MSFVFLVLFLLEAEFSFTCSVVTTGKASQVLRQEHEDGTRTKGRVSCHVVLVGNSSRSDNSRILALHVYGSTITGQGDSNVTSVILQRHGRHITIVTYNQNSVTTVISAEHSNITHFVVTILYNRDCKHARIKR